MQNEEQKQTIRIYNPSLEDFTYIYFDENDEGKAYTLPAMEIVTLPYKIGIFMAKHLADRLIIKEGVKTNWEDDEKMWKEKIFV